MIYLLLLLAILSLTTCGSSPKGGDNGPYGRIETCAGTGEAGKGQEKASLRKALFYLPLDLTFGPDDRPYIVDWNNHRVRVVTQGHVTTLIGTGELGDAPAGPAREIGLNHPTHISFDLQGRLVLSAWHNSMILRYDLTSDYIQPICGTGEGAYSGDGGPAGAAQIYAPTGQAGPPTSRIAIDDSGTLYIADTFNNRIRKVDLTTDVITTITGNGAFAPAPRGAKAHQLQTSRSTGPATSPSTPMAVSFSPTPSITASAPLTTTALSVPSLANAARLAMRATATIRNRHCSAVLTELRSTQTTISISPTPATIAFAWSASEISPRRANRSSLCLRRIGQRTRDRTSALLTGLCHILPSGARLPTEQRS